MIICRSMPPPHMSGNGSTVLIRSFRLHSALNFRAAAGGTTKSLLRNLARLFNWIEMPFQESSKIALFVGRYTASASRGNHCRVQQDLYETFDHNCPSQRCPFRRIQAADAANSHNMESFPIRWRFYLHQSIDASPHQLQRHDNIALNLTSEARKPRIRTFSPYSSALVTLMSVAGLVNGNISN